jgi:hypothetical protein
MSDDRPQRISIGFTGGQSLSARVKADELVRLRKALGTVGWHELNGEGGTVALDLSNVVFVQVDSDEHSVGFGT